MATDLVTGLGGTSGFGENSVARTDDGSSAFIDLTSVLPGGLNFFGAIYTGLWINNNGSVSFASAVSAFTPTAITGSTANPLITPFWADVDTRGGVIAPSPGGTSTGSNLVWYDLDTAAGAFTVTWDDVGYFNRKVNKTNAFQLRLLAVGTEGDFDIEFRYEDVSWTTGDFSGGSNGLGGTVARAGWSSGNGLDYLELPQSGDQDQVLALESASNIGTPGTFLFEIRDGAVAANLAIGDVSIVEGDGGAPSYAVIPVTLTAPLDAPLTVRYATGNGTARAGQDYVAQRGVLVFGPGETRQEIRVEILGDTLGEIDETFVVRIAGGVGATIGDAQATVTIVNDEGLSVADASGVEGTAGSPGSMVFTVRLATASAGTVTVDYATQDGSANAGTDYIATSGTLTFAPGQTSQTVTVPLLGDLTGETSEALTLLLSGVAGAIIADGSATGTIVDDDRVSIADVSVTEGTASTPGSVTVTVRLAGPAGQQVTVDYATEDGTAAAGDDYTATSGTVTIAAGQASATFTVPILRDAAVEGTESFGVRLSNPTGATIEDGLATVVIIDDDGFSISDVWVTEGSGGGATMTFTVALSSALSSSVTIDYATSDGTASAGVDYTATSGTLTFTAGQTARTFIVPIAGDADLEGDETFAVTLSNPSGGSILRGAATGTILDDDGLSISNVSVTEGTGGTVTATATVSLTTSASTVTVDWATVDGTATAGEDYVAASGSLTFAPGETSQTISVAINPDSRWEANEAFRIELSSPVSAPIVDGSGSVLISNDDARDAPEVSLTFGSITEGSGDAAGTMRFVVALSYSVSSTVTVDYATADRTAVAGSDYVATSGTLVIAAGQSSGVIEVPILADSLVEGDETFVMTLSNPTGGASIAAGGVFGRILNDDASVAVAAASADAAEGNSGSTAFTFTVTRTGDLGTRHGLRWDAVPSNAIGPAADAADFAGGVLPSGLVFFAPGETTQTITVNVAGDTAAEPGEGFVVRLSNPSAGLGIGTAEAAGHVGNDDTFSGTSGTDRLIAGSDDDLLLGLGGDDTLWGEGGDDTLLGGDGQDRLVGGDGADRLVGGSGIDEASYVTETAAITIDLADGTGSGGDAQGDALVGIEVVRGGAGDDSLTGADGDETLYGVGGNDTLTGRDGQDMLDGGDGANLLRGGLGNDVFVVRSGADTVEDSGGMDTVEPYVSYTLPDGVEVLAIWSADDIDGTGEGGANRLFGGDGANALRGLGGDDVISAGSGEDLLVGGAGADSLTGGAGADSFRYEAVAESRVGASDVIRDFTSGVDILDLRALGTEMGGWGATRFVSGSTFTGAKQVAWDAAAGVLRVEANGNLATAEFTLALRGASLAEGDILFA